MVINNDPRLKAVIALLKPALNASLDAICVVNFHNELAYMNIAMKNLLGSGAREFKKKPLFCDHLKLQLCSKSCQVQEAIKSGESISLHETTAVSKGNKLRLIFKLIPIYDPEESKKPAPIGAIISVRDTTAEVLLQAKYHKLIHLMTERDEVIKVMQGRLGTLREAVKKIRENG